MTRRTNARIAGATYLLYIAVSFPAISLFDRAIDAQGTAAQLALIARHATDLRVVVVLSLLACFAAFTLAVALYAITRDEDRELALLALTCRVAEGVVNAINVLAIVGVLWLATDVDAAREVSTTNVLGSFLLSVQVWSTAIAATFFAVGSTIFSWLLLRGRMIPRALAWLGVLASALVVPILPFQLIGLAPELLTQLMWIPVGVFELVLAPWLLIKGVAAPQPEPSR